MLVLFVCTGNLCRSPLAEYLLRRRLAERGVAGIEVGSAGTFAQPGSPALAGAIRAAAARGVDLLPHRARRFEPRLAAPGDLVLVMERMHERQVRAQLQDSKAIPRLDPSRIRLLGSYVVGGPEEIGDPIGGPQVAFEQCVERISSCLDGLVPELAAQSGRPVSKVQNPA